MCRSLGRRINCSWNLFCIFCTEVMGYALKTDRWSYHEWRDFKTGRIVGQELYVAQTDPLETVNQVGTVAAASQIPALADLYRVDRREWKRIRQRICHLCFGGWKELGRSNYVEQAKDRSFCSPEHRISRSEHEAVYQVRSNRRPFTEGTLPRRHR